MMLLPAAVNTFTRLVVAKAALTQRIALITALKLPKQVTIELMRMFMARAVATTPFLSPSMDCLQPVICGIAKLTPPTK